MVTLGVVGKITSARDSIVPSFGRLVVWRYDTAVYLANSVYDDIASFNKQRTAYVQLYSRMTVESGAACCALLNRSYHMAVTYRSASCWQAAHAPCCILRSAYPVSRPSTLPRLSRTRPGTPFPKPTGTDERWVAAAAYIDTSQAERGWCSSCAQRWHPGAGSRSPGAGERRRELRCT